MCHRLPVARAIIVDALDLMPVDIAEIVVGFLYCRTAACAQQHNHAAQLLETVMSIALDTYGGRFIANATCRLEPEPHVEAAVNYICSRVFVVETIAQACESYANNTIDGITEWVNQSHVGDCCGVMSTYEKVGEGLLLWGSVAEIVRHNFDWYGFITAHADQAMQPDAPEWLRARWGGGR